MMILFAVPDPEVTFEKQKIDGRKVDHWHKKTTRRRTVPSCNFGVGLDYVFYNTVVIIVTSYSVCALSPQLFNLKLQIQPSPTSSLTITPHAVKIFYVAWHSSDSNSSLAMAIELPSQN